MSSLVEMVPCRFRNISVFDIALVLTKPSVKCFLSFSDVLFTTTITVDQIHHIGVSAGNIGVDLHDLRGSLGSD